MKKITAKFNSKCAETDKPIKKGESMYYDYSSKKCYCLESNKVKDMDAEQDDNAQEAAYFDNFCQQNNI